MTDFLCILYAIGIVATGVVAGMLTGYAIIRKLEK